MDNKNTPMLELITRPAFYVVNGKITEVNQAATALLLRKDTEIIPMLVAGADEYKAFASGTMYVSMNIGDIHMEATVLATENGHLFVLEESEDLGVLQAMALAARELREPLAGMMFSSSQMLSEADPKQASEYNRRMYQLLRVVSNMSDAINYCQPMAPRESFEICDLLEEYLSKAAELLETINITLDYQLPNTRIYTIADPEKLERALYNLISNAVKHTEPGGTITVRLQKHSKLFLSVTDNGPGLDASVKSNVYTRYLRTPSLADFGQGIGLGMVLVRAAAQVHGGTVLIDTPENGGTRVTMTLSIRQQKNALVRTPMLHIDYASERDHALQELADVLPSSLYSTDEL